MDLDLSDDQVALRDGIASMLEGRFDSDRIRAGFDRAMFAELAEAGVFSLRADGFSWADCVVVFEQLGRYCVPGPLVASLLLGEGRITGLVEDSEPVWIEYLDSLDDVVVLSGPDTRRVEAGAISGAPSTWPLDPLTPIARVERLPAGNPINADAAERRREGATLTAAFQLGLADRCTELAVAYAKERVQFDRPIAAFQAIKHLCADMLVRTEVARAAVYAAGARPRRCRPRVVRRPRSGYLRRQGHGGRSGGHERQGRDAGVRRHGLHVGSRCASLLETRVGA